MAEERHDTASPEDIGAGLEEGDAGALAIALKWVADAHPAVAALRDRSSAPPVRVLELLSPGGPLPWAGAEALGARLAGTGKRSLLVAVTSAAGPACRVEVADGVARAVLCALEPGAAALAAEMGARWGAEQVVLLGREARRRVAGSLAVLVRSDDLMGLEDSLAAAAGLEVVETGAEASDEILERAVAASALDGLLPELGGSGPAGGPCARLDHVGIAVEGLDEALTFWRDALGLELEHVEEVATEGVRVGMLPVGEASLELLEALPGEGPVRTFLERRGPGIHHVCLRVSDVRAAVARLEAAGARLVGESPRPGAGGCSVAFVHPKSASGVLLELSQPGAGGGAEA